MTPLTLAQYAAAHGFSRGAVFLWNRAGLLPGVFKDRINGRLTTLVPADAPPPKLKRGSPQPRPFVSLTPAVRSLAKRMFLRHRRAAKKLEIANETGEQSSDKEDLIAIAERWQEFIPDASEELARIGKQTKSYDRREWRQYLEVS